MGLFDKVISAIDKNHQMKEQYREQSGNSIFTTLFNTGAHGEYLTYRKISRLSDKNYCIANCYIPKGDGTFSEIDMLMVHETGIYVFESKNYSGWIFGNQNQSKWMQILPVGQGRSERHQFYNPIWQNQKHIRYLQDYLGDGFPFFSYIVFSERCTLKDVQHDSNVRVVYRDQLNRTLRYDIETKPVVFTEGQMEVLFNRLKQFSSKSNEEKNAHVDSIREKKNNIQNGICPICNGRLLQRTVSRGPNIGRTFYGCSNYPKCKFTTNKL